MTLRLGTFLAISFLLAATGCRDEQAGPKRAIAPPAAVGKVLEGVPELTFRSGAAWANGAVIYLGSRVSPSDARPGQTVQLAHAFTAVRPPPKGYRFFVHVVDSETGQMLVNADHEFQGGAMPLENWPVGKVVEDVHSLVIPKYGGQAQVRLGFWNEAGRLPLDGEKGQDGQERAVGPTLSTGEPLPEYPVARAAHPPTIDGDLSDVVWRNAKAVELVGSLDGRKTQVRTTARLLYDDKNLYVAFECEDPDVWGTFMKRDDPLYTQEAVEIFLDADADGKTYDEIEVSPNNTVFDASFVARRTGMDLSYDSQVKSAVRVTGTLNNPDDRDVGWTVEMAIPIAKLTRPLHVPPRKGDRWRFNLYRLEHLDRQRVEGQAFSPLYVGDFHHLPRFAWLTFE